MRRFFWLLLGAIVLAALGAAAFYMYRATSYDVVARLPIGDASGQIAARLGEGDEAAICPLGIEALEGARVAVVDLGNAKIVNLDVAANTYRESRLALASGRIAEGVLYDATQQQLLLWENDVISGANNVSILSLEEDNAYRPEAEGGGFFEGGVIDEDALARMQALGFPAADDGSGFLASTQYLRATQRVILREWSETLTLPEGILEAGFTLSDQGVEIRIKPPEGDERTTAYVLEGKFVSAQLYRRIIPGKAAIVISESSTQSGALAFSQSVVMVDLRTGAVELYRAPTNPAEICQPKQQLTISESGAIYALSVQADGARILRLKPATPWTSARFTLERAYAQYAPQQTPAPAGAPSPPAEVEAATEPGANMTPLPETGANMTPLPAAGERAYVLAPRRGTISREDTISNACLYLQHNWTLAEGNYELTGRTECRIRPPVLDNRVGAQITSIPYAWGAADSLQDFDRKLALNRPAGDVCTTSRGGNVVRDTTGEVNGVFTAGVDCSGFVLRAWGWSGGRYYTSSLGDISTPITEDELRPGDILNKPGSHVRMFLSWYGPSVVEYIEASVSCGGVCIRTAPLDRFAGYQPMRPRHLTGDDVSLSRIADLCGARR